VRLTAKKSVLRGAVAIPGSKSHTIRSVAFGSLAAGESEIFAPLVCSDTIAAVNCYRRLGAEIDCGESWRIKGVGGCPVVPDDIIDVGNSGTTLRFALGSAALLKAGAAVFTCDAQIRSRPLGPLMKSLNTLGANCFSTQGNSKAPVVVHGPITGGQTSIEVISSQYLSSLLINTPLAQDDTIINVIRLNEYPYIDLTLKYLDEQGIKYEKNNYQQFTIKGSQAYNGFEKRIPADFSSATFFFCAGAILDAELVLEGLDFNDLQGDKVVVDVLRKMGADIEIDGSRVIVKPGELKGTEVNMNAIPDALPGLAVVACFAEGQTRLFNVAQARLKETDRIKVMAEELTKMGAEVVEQPDGLLITGSKLHAAELRGHSDHRIVMALSLATMAVEDESTIDTAEAVDVTFPDYVKLMQGIGGKIKLK